MNGEFIFDWSADPYDGCPGHEAVADKCPCCAALERIRVLEGALRRIAQPGYGIEASDDAKTIEEYWGRMALMYRDLARAALDAKRGTG